MVLPTSSFISSVVTFSCPCLYRLFSLSFFIFQLSFMSLACISFTVFLSFSCPLYVSLAYSVHVHRLLCTCPLLILSLSLGDPVPVFRLPYSVPRVSCPCLLLNLPMSLAYPTLALFMSLDYPLSFPWFTLSQSLLRPFPAPDFPVSEPTLILSRPSYNPVYAPRLPCPCLSL